jgi:hypothetical protein
MDPSQFGDIFQESFFIDYLQDDVRIVKELPVELQSLHLNNSGSLVSPVVTVFLTLSQKPLKHFLLHALPSIVEFMALVK